MSLNWIVANGQRSSVGSASDGFCMIYIETKATDDYDYDIINTL